VNQGWCRELSQEKMMHEFHCTWVATNDLNSAKPEPQCQPRRSAIT
jgi:hypothetical protein